MPATRVGAGDGQGDRMGKCGRRWMVGALLGAIVAVAQVGGAAVPPARAQTTGDVADEAATAGGETTSTGGTATTQMAAPAFAPAAPVSPGAVSLRAAGPARRQAACRPSTPAVAPTPGRSVPIYKGPTECNAAALTFDAGSDRGYAELILDILRERNVPASFYVTGVWGSHSPDVIKRIVDEGHELSNHTWDHSSFTGFSTGSRPQSVGERRLQLERTDEFFQSITGRTTRPYFRPPYGDINEGVYKDVADAGYDYTMMWTIDSFGWNGLPAAGIVNRCLQRAEPGAIYLFHVGAQSEDALALGAIIDGLLAQGLSLVTVTDLLGL